jgi:ribosomal protein S6
MPDESIKRGTVRFVLHWEWESLVAPRVGWARQEWGQSLKTTLQLEPRDVHELRSTLRSQHRIIRMLYIVVKKNGMQR